MARLRYNGLTAALGAALTSSATSVTFGATLTHSNGVQVPTVASPDYIPLSILDSSGNFSEIVYLTAYTAGSTTGTISRAAEGAGAAVAHNSGDKVIHGPTAASVGGGYQGEHVGGAYRKNDLTSLLGTMYTARVDTTNAPVTRYYAPASTVDDTSAWYQNSVASVDTTAHEVVLINNLGSDKGSVISKASYVDSLDSLTLKATVSLAGSADGLTIGVYDATASTSADIASGATGLYGVYLDIYNTQVHTVTNGAVNAGVSAPNAKGSGYEEWWVKFTDDGTNLGIALTRASGVTFVTSWTGLARPSFASGWRIAVGANTGGSAGTFKVSGKPVVVGPTNADWRSLYTMIDKS